MKIALFQYPEYKIPTDGYGPKQNIIEMLAKGFDKLGHQITTFATEDSVLPGEIIKVSKTGINDGLNDDPEIQADVDRIYRSIAIGELIKRSGDFDVIHNHAGFTLLPIVEVLKAPVFHTLHGTYTNEHYRKIFDIYAKAGRYIPISKAQMEAIPELNYTDVVYHGINIGDFEFNDKPKDQLVFLGRIARVKGVHSAIEIAKKANKKLVIAGPVDVARPGGKKYFEEKVKPFVDGDQIQYVGEVNLEEKRKLLSESSALIFPIEWVEAFGLVMIESLACGTPVIAYNIGAPAEVVENGKTGFVCESGDINGMVESVGKIEGIKRSDCRQSAEERFSKEIMVENYIKLFEKELAHE